MRFHPASLLFFTGAAALLPLSRPLPARAADPLAYCNAVQNRVGFIRYPLGALAAWSSTTGESADVMTRVPRIYPSLDSVAVRGPKEDWRASISGDPSMLRIVYQTNKPPGATCVEITVAPHTAVYRVSFPAGDAKKHLVFDFGRGTIEDWSALSKWTERRVERGNNRRFNATIGKPGSKGAFYAVRFSTPCVSSGALDSTGTTAEGVTSTSGIGATMYAQFDAPVVTVAVAESFTGMKEAEEFLAQEAGDFDQVRSRCRAAWEQVLSRIDLDGPENSKRMAYTAFYTMYVNCINGDEGCYAQYYPHPKTLASSAYWQFIGGFQSCCWDNFRTAYPALMLACPEVMSDIVGTYLARSQRDGCMDGNICLFSGPTGGHRNVRFSPVLAAQACEAGIAADYPKIYAALKENFNNDAYVPASLASLGYVTQPPAGGKACSETLEFSTSLASMALLAQAGHDPDAARRFHALSKCYTNLWDPVNLVFRVRNSDGSWGIINNTNWTWNPNPQGLFEGTSRDWMFSIPHDPYGLIGLPGQQRFVERVVDYCLNDTWFNDNQYHYPYLLYYAGAASECQRIIRTSWVPMFEAGVIYEGVRPKPPHNGWQTHYTSNAGWLWCSMLGLYPVPAPAGQFLISSPSLTKAVLRRDGKKISLEARNNSESNIYVRSVKLDGKPYPAYMIPAKRLAAGANIELEMGSDPQAGLGPLYVSSSDGFILKAELPSVSRLIFTVEAPVGEATSKVYSRTRPARILSGGQETHEWTYDEAVHLVTLRSTGTTEIEVVL